MRPLALAPGLTLAAAAAVAAAHVTAAGAAARAGCAPGAHPTTIRGHSAMTFCGRAKATVRLGRRTLRFSRGKCSRIGTFFSVNIGTTVVEARYTGPRPAYFGITAGRARPGKQANPSIAFTARGKAYALTRATVTLAKGLRKGTFVGVVFALHAKVAGSFTC